MKTEVRLTQTLKELMSNNVPLDSITVTVLTKKCKINRQTFYYHFHDIYDLLTLVFLNEKIEGLLSSKTIDNVITSIYNHFQANRKFIEATIGSAAKDLYESFLRDNLYQTFLKMISYYDDKKVTSIAQRKDFAGMNAAAFAQGITHHLESSKIKTLESVKNVFASYSKDFVSSAIRNIEKNSRERNVR